MKSHNTGECCNVIHTDGDQPYRWRSAVQLLVSLSVRCRSLSDWKINSMHLSGAIPATSIVIDQPCSDYGASFINDQLCSYWSVVTLFISARIIDQFYGYSCISIDKLHWLLITPVVNDRSHSYWCGCIDYWSASVIRISTYLLALSRATLELSVPGPRCSFSPACPISRPERRPPAASASSLLTSTTTADCACARNTPPAPSAHARIPSPRQGPRRRGEPVWGICRAC